MIVRVSWTEKGKDYSLLRCSPSFKLRGGVEYLTFLHRDKTVDVSRGGKCFVNDKLAKTWAKTPIKLEILGFGVWYQTKVIPSKNIDLSVFVSSLPSESKPLVNSGDDGETLYEWWNKDKKLTLCVSDQEFYFIKMDGDEIEDGFTSVIDRLWELFTWLQEN